MAAEPKSNLLADVAEATRLMEGAEGVRRILRAVFRNGPIPIRELARQCTLPVPVVAAVRGELEKRGLLTRRGGLALTDQGVEAVREHLGLTCREDISCGHVVGLPEELADLVEQMSAVCRDRPVVDVTLDQSHATPETALRRAVYLFEHDALEGRDLLFLGDDDLTSIAVGLLSRRLGCSPGRIVVLECDTRLSQFLSEASPEYGPISVVEHDLRHPLPEGLPASFDVFFTDPPYTLAGLELFVSRGVSALRPEVGKQGYICFGHRSPQEAARAAGLLVEMGLAPVEVLPGFNSYDGAQLLAGTSQMIRTTSTGVSGPTVTDVHTGPLYTADLRARS